MKGRGLPNSFAAPPSENNVKRRASAHTAGRVLLAYAGALKRTAQACDLGNDLATQALHRELVGLAFAQLADACGIKAVVDDAGRLAWYSDGYVRELHAQFA